MGLNSKELEKWQTTLNQVKKEPITFGPYFAYQYKNTPRRILFTLARYKFAAKMIGEKKNVLEIGCSEGYCSILLSEFANKVVAIDIEKDSIIEAKKTFKDIPNIEFKNMDFLGANIEEFDAIVSFDVIEHIYKESEAEFFNSINRNLSKYGICIIGTPNITSDQYASKFSKEGHVNMYSWERLESEMKKYFHQVFMFSSNDEMVHTGFYPMSQYLIAMGVCKKN